MGYTREREEFIALAIQEGLDLATARRLLRYATTLHRLAEAACNGTWPESSKFLYKSTECPECHGFYASASFRSGVCPHCRTAQLVLETLPAGYSAKIGGDPRGAVLKIVVPSGRTNDWGKTGICVPTR